METDTNSCRSEIVPVSCKYPLTKRNVLNLSVNVFSTKVVIGDTIFTSLARSSDHAKVSPLAVQRQYLHFSVILRT